MLLHLLKEELWEANKYHKTFWLRFQKLFLLISTSSTRNDIRQTSESFKEMQHSSMQEHNLSLTYWVRGLAHPVAEVLYTGRSDYLITYNFRETSLFVRQYTTLYAYAYA